MLSELIDVATIEADIAELTIIHVRKDVYGLAVRTIGVEALCDAGEHCRNSL